jgi:predicted transcriptional regulator
VVVANRNVTLSLPEELLKEAKVLAARKESSLSALLAGALREMIDRESGYALAREEELFELERGFDLGTHGEITWSRDEVHERR